MFESNAIKELRVSENLDCYKTFFTTKTRAVDDEVDKNSFTKFQS